MTNKMIKNDAPIPLFESLSIEEWEREFHAWIDGHDRTTRVPSAESLLQAPAPDHVLLAGHARVGGTAVDRRDGRASPGEGS